MLVFWKAGLILLAAPKTGTHAVEQALGAQADLAFRHPPRLKHMRNMWARKTILRLVDKSERDRFQTVAVVRDPVDWLGSWFRFRQREDIRGQATSTATMSFDQFLRDHMKTPPPPHAAVGSQWNFIRDENDSIGVDYLFAYERFETYVSFLEDRLKTKINLERSNVSPKGDLTAKQDTMAALRGHLAKEFEVHAALMRHDGT